METRTVDEYELLETYRQLDERAKTTVLTFLQKQKEICKTYDVDGNKKQIPQFIVLK